MGSCASIHKATTHETAINRAIHFEAKTDKLLIPDSALDDNKHVHVDLSVIKNFDAYNGSKEEAFFDSQPWLESDCEDDFYSVRGDFTPSCGSSPVHHSFPAAPAGNQPSPSMPVPSPTGQKKRLSELFRESRGEDMYQYVADLNAPANKSNTEGKSTLLELPPKSPEDTPYISGTKSVCSSERTPNGKPLFEREKSVNSTQCCLPTLISYRSFRERKKMSPAVAVKGKA